MKRRLNTILSLVILLWLFTASAAYSVDSHMWEDGSGYRNYCNQPNKEMLYTHTAPLFWDYFKFPKYENTYRAVLDKYINKLGNKIDFSVKPPFKDVGRFTMEYKNNDDGTFSGLVIFYFVKGSITLLDVLGRYGSSEANIETTESLAKQISYAIEYERVAFDNELKIPALKGWNAKCLEYADFIFHSEDKVNVDFLYIAYKVHPRH